MQAHLASPQLGMHDLLPGLDQHLVSLAMQSRAQEGSSTAGGTAGTAGGAAHTAGRASLPSGGTFAALQQPPAGWAAQPAGGTAAAAATGAHSTGSAQERSDLTDKQCLLALLLASDAGPPPLLLSLDATAEEVRDVLAHLPHLPQQPTAPAVPADMAAAAAAVTPMAGAMAGAPVSAACMLGMAHSMPGAAHSMPGAALSIPSAALSVPGLPPASSEALLDATLFRLAFAPAQQAELGPEAAAAAAAGGERAPSPDLLIWPGASAHTCTPDPADPSWQV